jgi:hypothetical protein
MADQMRHIEYLLMGLMVSQLVRLWWRLNRRRVKKWWQRVKDHHPRQRHPKSPKDCPHCCCGLHVETCGGQLVYLPVIGQEHQSKMG